MNRKIELKPITPDMADDWREHIMPELPESFAVSFRVLAAAVYDRLEQRGVTLRGTLANAVLAMATEGEIALTQQDNIQNAFADSRAA
jgi:hypothetical protein